MKTIAFAALVFFSALFIGEANAQIPFPNQSTPIVVDYSGYSQVSPDGTVYWTAYIDHYGVGIPNHYDTWEDHIIYKSVRGGWAQQIVMSSREGGYNNASLDYPHRTSKTVWSRNLLLAFGPGNYKSEFNFYAENPITGSRVFLTRSWVVFTVQ